MGDLPTWLFALSHLLTGGLGGVVTAWITSRGSARKGDAAVMEAADGRIEMSFDRLEADIERLSRRLETERKECDQRIGALEDALDTERGHRRELEETVRILADHLEDLSEPLPVELDQ